jgi:hypothetical protein
MVTNVVEQHAIEPQQNLTKRRAPRGMTHPCA